MTTPAEPNRQVWQPLTPRGVAAFARAPLARLLLVQFVFATLAAAVAAWFLSANWFPTIGEAIGQLPARGEIVAGRLNWPEDSPRLLAGGSFLSFTVDLDHRGGTRAPAQIEIEFGREDVRIFSLLGYAGCAYPKDWIIEFNRPELEPRWGAWRPPILGITVGAVIAGLMVSWALLATAYFPVALLAGFFTNRDLDLTASWKLAGAALMPGALLATAGVGLFGLGVLDLVRFLAVMGVHFVAGWIYLFISPLCAPKISAPDATVRNPFVIPAEKKTEGGPRD